MKQIFLLILFSIGCASQLFAQRRCASFQYAQQALRFNPSLQKSQQNIEQFIRGKLNSSSWAASNLRPAELSLISIPVVVHIVYHKQAENISSDAVTRQLAALNRDYQRTNADSNKTPGAFKSVAADCKIEFVLAKVDPQGRATSGIERVYSPVNKWEIEGDKVKSRSTSGAGAWDARYYLNVWVCNLEDLLGYSSVMGDDLNKDGVVINYTVFDDLEDGGAYNSGRTAVHEIGHWLSLKHLWGDADCGDDEVADTPNQSTFTTGCPSGIRRGCSNSPNGEMYMNFMDYTNDPCMNLFTNGQRDRMHVLFEPGGLRHSILSSKALGIPWVEEISAVTDSLRWLYPKLYPDPAQTEVVLDFRYDPQWVGKELIITNASGQVLIRHVITSKVETIDISKLHRGIYFIGGNKQGVKLAEKFIKL